MENIVSQTFSDPKPGPGQACCEGSGENSDGHKLMKEKMQKL